MRTPAQPAAILRGISAPAICIREIGSFHLGGRMASLSGLLSRQLSSTPGGPVHSSDPNGEGAFLIARPEAACAQTTRPGQSQNSIVSRIADRGSELRTRSRRSHGSRGRSASIDNPECASAAKRPQIGVEWPGLGHCRSMRWLGQVATNSGHC
jgi:hypothetical protein